MKKKYHDLILRALTHKQGFLKRYYSLHHPIGVMESHSQLFPPRKVRMNYEEGESYGVKTRDASGRKDRELWSSVESKCPSLGTGLCIVINTSPMTQAVRNTSGTHIKPPTIVVIHVQVDTQNQSQRTIKNTFIGKYYLQPSLINSSVDHQNSSKNVISFCCLFFSF